METHHPHHYRSRHNHKIWWPLNQLFEFNQPLERYRLHVGMCIADFATFLGLTEQRYIGIVTGDHDLPTPLRTHIARRLRVLPWLINETAPSPTPEQLTAVNESLMHTREHGYLVMDPETLEPTGEIVFDQEENLPPNMETPEHLVCLAAAIFVLEQVHNDHTDPDYPRLRAEVELRIREQLGIGPDSRFDSEVWAQKVLQLPVES